jgi:P27 family predicted phage terminase small subunit
MRKKSVREHKERGTYRKGRHKAAPAYSGTVSAPKWLSAEAREEWNRVFPLLDAKKLAQAPDIQLLASYCTAYAGYRQALTKVEEQGPVIEITSTTRTGKTQKPVRNPWLTVVMDWQRQMLAAAKLFGISPLNRQRIVVADEDTADEYQQPQDSNAIFADIMAMEEQRKSKKQ